MIVNQCSQRRYLRMRGYRNRDESKIHVSPDEDVGPFLLGEMRNKVSQPGSFLDHFTVLNPQASLDL